MRKLPGSFAFALTNFGSGEPRENFSNERNALQSSIISPVMRPARGRRSVKTQLPVDLKISVENASERIFR